jgi:Asp-tRNA(Asn)/Glu-tRNA(Gln) amidotransferase A subunit family amidase
MNTIARPDGRDMSVSDIPFNWPGQVDIRKLRVGYIPESFDELNDPVVKANAMKVLDTLRSLGVANFVPMTIPVSHTNVSSLGVESAVFFDELVRSGKMTGTRMNRQTSRLVPAIEFLQQQRLRMMMMTDLAAATANVDVYVVAANASSGAGGGRARGAAAPDPAAAAAGAEPPARGGGGGAGRGRGGGGGGTQNPAQRHSTMANLACYPALNVPNGFTAAGTPTHVTFFARPFGETELIGLAKAFQDAARFHETKPVKMDA